MHSRPAGHWVHPMCLTWAFQLQSKPPHTSAVRRTQQIVQRMCGCNIMPMMKELTRCRQHLVYRKTQLLYSAIRC